MNIVSLFLSGKILLKSPPVSLVRTPTCGEAKSGQCTTALINIRKKEAADIYCS